MAISAQPWRFFDPMLGVPDPAAPPSDTTAVYLLERQLDAGRECFRLLSPYGYLDRVAGVGVVAPADLPIGPELLDELLDEAVAADGGSQFKTDLTSVPDLFTWLVPKTGLHLPAAIVHDSMIGAAEYLVVRAGPGEPVEGQRPAEIVWRPADGTPAPFTAVDADRIFRDAMADSGTAVVRRWLIWTAVTLRTLVARDGSSSNPVVRWYYAAIAVLTLLVIAWLGYEATANLFEREGEWPLAHGLFWIVSELPGPLDRLPCFGTGFGARLASGVAVAVVAPLLFGLAWLRFRVAGMIAGVALALLYHVTLVLLTISAAYTVVEAIVTGGRRAPARLWSSWGGRLAVVVVVAVPAAVVWACVRHG